MQSTSVKPGLSRTAKILIGLFIGFAVLDMGFVAIQRAASPQATGDTLPAMSKPVPGQGKPFDMQDVKVDMNWSTGGFDTVMLADFTITNRSACDVKDFKVRCTLFGNSGTRIDSTSKTLYEVVPAGAKKTFRKVNMGFIGTQAASASCEITDLTVIR